MRFNPKLTVLASLLASACAGISPQANQQLEEARAAYRTAAADPAVQANAQAELKSAQDSLQIAERMAENGEPTELVEHNAYLAEQRSRIATRTADIRRSEASIAAAAEERRRVQLEVREREAVAAREQAQQALQAQLQVQQAEMARKEAESRAAILENERLEKERHSSAQAGLGAEVKRLESELADLRAKETNRGWVLTLKNELLFDPGGATLKPGAQRALDNLAQFLTKHRERAIAIEGFTDSTGSKDLNQQLSEKRAWQVKAALVARGIESTRIDARGYGPSFPVASNETPTGRQLNRRVEVVIDPSSASGGSSGRPAAR
jgi:outer membrane protein OmpA-like peptidoglycan-associated protein